MGLLNQLFGKRRGIAGELAMDDSRRMALWQQHLLDHSRRESLAKYFSYDKIDEALRNPKEVQAKLKEIESLISSELVGIPAEERLDEEIIADIKKLKSTDELDSLSRDLVYEKRKRDTLLALFQEIHNVLTTELHLIKRIKKDMKKKRLKKEVLLELFRLIFHKEAMLYKPFREEFYSPENKAAHAEISLLARAILLEEKIKEELETDKEKFIKEMVRAMARSESMRGYRKLGEDILLNLAQATEIPLAGVNIYKGLPMIEKLMRNDNTMYHIVRSLRPKYDDAKIKIIISAFRQAYGRGHFDRLAIGI